MRVLLEKDVEKEAELKAHTEKESEAQVPIKGAEQKEKALVPPVEENQEKAEEPLKENAEMNVDEILGTSIPKKNVSQSKQINIQDPS